jgi:leucyl aminopeptidase (aminopeptidase T)
MFERTVPIDYKILREKSRKIKKLLTKAETAELKTEKGTDIVIGLKGRKGMADDGDFTKPGRGGNLPCGEIFISPELSTSNGIIVFDGSISSYKGEILIKHPITVNVKNGFVKKISGKNEAKELVKTLRNAEKKTVESKLPKAYIKNIRNLGELGIGLNPKAGIVGNMLEDEKVLSTCHVAIGTNYDNDANAIIHLDGLIKKPTIDLRFKNKKMKIMENGILKI